LDSPTIFSLDTGPQHPTVLQTHCDNGMDQLHWPEGCQIRQEIWSREPAGWNSSKWSITLAACHGETVTSSHSLLNYTPTPLLCKFPVIDDSELLIADEEPLIAMPQSVSWTSSSGLSGGLRMPCCYRPLCLWVEHPGPRPKPRLAYKTASTTDHAVLAGYSGGEVTSEVPAVKKGVGKSRVRLPLDELVDNGDKLMHLHRSKRAHTKHN
jgi:hypothetical protein